MSLELPIARDYGLGDLRPLLSDITATVLVQAADTEAETAFMLDVARTSAGLVRGVVGWTDLASPRAPAHIAELADDPLLKGLRPMLQDIEDTSWILRPAVHPALEVMVRYGVRFDALLKPRHLPVIGELAQRHPDLPVVIDHAAKPDIANGHFQPWASPRTYAVRVGPLSQRDRGDAVLGQRDPEHALSRKAVGSCGAGSAAFLNDRAGRPAACYDIRPCGPLDSLALFQPTAVYRGLNLRQVQVRPGLQRAAAPWIFGPLEAA